MKIFNLKKLPILSILLSLNLFCFCNLATFASDYQYKVLDTRYNPSASKLLEGKTEMPTETEDISDEKQGFDFLRFIALLAMLLFPIMVVKYSFKTFVKVYAELKEKGIDYIPEEDKKDNNLKNEDDVKQVDLSVVTDKTSKIKNENDNIEDQNNNIIENQIEKIQHSTTIPIKSQRTVMLDKAKLTKDKGLCIVQHDEKYALVGYINNKVFLLKKFDELQQKEIRPRWTETVDDKDRYIVRLGTAYKALVEVGEKDINLLIEL